MKPILIVGAGPVGLTTALACQFYGLPFLLFEEDGSFSSDTKAGTILTRTLEAFRRFGVVDNVLSKALRVEEIGDIERATGHKRDSVRTALLRDETRFPFVVNMPQHHLEPLLAAGLADLPDGTTNLHHRFTSFEQMADGVVARFETPDGPREVEGSYLLACDGGRSTIRSQLNIAVEGHSLDVRYTLVDIKVDLDVDAPRDYPYLAYFSDPTEWMILVRQPHCWRFIFPSAPDAPDPTPDDLRDKARHFIGQVAELEVLNTVTYRVHHRVASDWQVGRVFLMGDAAHLLTPMWALGLNSGVLDALNLSWRLAWVARGWASEELLDGYAAEQRPLAVHGAGEMAEAARAYMSGAGDSADTTRGDGELNRAMTRTLLGVRLDVNASGDWSIVTAQGRAIRVGDRIPDMDIHLGNGKVGRVHQLADDTFVAMHFCDARRKPQLPADAPGLRNVVVSRWDAPLDSGIRERSVLDVGDLLRDRLGVGPDTIVLVRPDDHVVAIVPMGPNASNDAYQAVVSGAAGRRRQ